MKKDFLFNIILLLGINLLIKPFYIFGIDRSVQNAVGEESYGLFFTLFNLAYLLQIVNDFGIQNFNSRNIAQNNQLIQKHFPSLLVLKTGLSFLFIGALFIVAWILGYASNVYHLLFIISGSLIFSSFFLFCRANLAGLGKYTTDSLLSIADKVIMIIICAYLLWLSPNKESFKIEWFAYAQLASFILSAALAFILLKAKIPKFELSKDRNFYISIFKKSLPFALVILLMTIYTRIDAVMIERLLPDGEQQAGIYAAGYRILDASNMLGYLVAGLLLPMFAKLLKDKKVIEDLLLMSFQFVFVLIFTVAIACFFFQSQIMEALYTEGDAYYGKVFGLLMLGSVAINVNYVFGTLLTANANMKRLNILFAVSVLLNIILNFILIKESKAYGAAFATLITQGLVTLVEIYYCLVVFKLKIKWPLMMRVFGFTSISVLSVFTISTYLSLNWILLLLLSIGIPLVLSLLFGLLSPKGFLMLMKNKVRG
jgi:O-antigen/teichoic acid export membrane protein